jgi:two-component system, OmpR family, sensor histidine kinase MtrB
VIPPRQPGRAGQLHHPVAVRARAALAHARVLWETIQGAFRRSLQLRMVTITLVLSTLLVGGFGYLVASHITSGLVDARVKDAQARIRQGKTDLESGMADFSSPNDPNIDSTVSAILNRLRTLSPTGGSATGAEVYLVATATNDAYASRPDNPVEGSEGAAVIPAALRRVVGTDSKLAHQIVDLHPSNGTDRLYLITGIPIKLALGSSYELYYLDPLDSEQETANLVYRTVILTGLALSILLAAVSGLVTRLVVNPVRVAAQTAQRLSAGLLNQRIPVRGEDDLALLGAAFNQMAANLQRHIVRLEDMSRLQRRFTSDVSHELRTPLTTVRMAADLIFSEREDFAPAVARSAELLQAELDRFEELLTQLLEISRFDAGFAILDAEPTDLVPIVRRVVQHLEPLAGRAGVVIELVVPDGSVIAEVDPRRIERVLRNLVGNAVEHAEGKPIRVELAADDTATAVTVRDHGIGLKPGEERLVFNRFWRADPSRARQTGGTGLGLSISLEDARLHGGWLEAWGAPDQGAQFRLTVPVRAGDRLLNSPLPLIPIDCTAALIPVALPSATGDGVHA